ncbi:MAG: hypothetical protein R3C51_02240 [Parvularculaceae bacterium]
MSHAENEFILGSHQIAPLGFIDRVRLKAARCFDDARAMTRDWARGWTSNRAGPTQGESEARFEDRFYRPYALAPTARTQARSIMLAALTMPAVFIVVVLASIAVFGQPQSDVATPAAKTASADTVLEQPARGAVSPSNVALQSDAFYAAPVMLDADARVTSISLDGDRVAMHVESAGGVEIIIYDLTRGRTVAAVPIKMSAAAGADHLAMVTPIKVD